jgi:hypothetical protein
LKIAELNPELTKEMNKEASQKFKELMESLFALLIGLMLLIFQDSGGFGDFFPEMSILLRYKIKGRCPSFPVNILDDALKI